MARALDENGEQYRKSEWGGEGGLYMTENFKNIVKKLGKRIETAESCRQSRNVVTMYGG